MSTVPTSDELTTTRRLIQFAGLLAGPVVAILLYILLPAQYTDINGEVINFTHAGRATLAVMAWMATWWLTEAIDISATALLPIAVFPLLGILSIGQATAPYAADLIFLFMGGFILALSMQRWGLDKRIALIVLRFVGTKPANMIGGFMLVTAVLSMWVSNTATAAMMLPIALSVVALVRQNVETAKRRNVENDDAPADDGGPTTQDRADASTTSGAIDSDSFDVSTFGRFDVSVRNFALSLMLGIAYAASIGGIATIIGSPPNGILVGFLSREYSVEISFVQWMSFGVPLTLIFLPLAWAMITWVLYPIGIKRIEGGREMIEREFRALGPMKAGEWVTMIVFFCTAFLWITRPLLAGLTFGEGDDAWQPLAGLSDSGIAIIAALALFVIPVQTSKHRNVETSKVSEGGETSKRRNVETSKVSEGEGDSSRRSRAPNLTFRFFDVSTFVMNWSTAKQLPWGILILFGGGLSLAAAVQANGVAEFFGALAANMGGVPIIVLVLAVTAGVIFLTELTSNTATTATLVPILAGLAPGLGVGAEMLIFPCAIAASCAFMMPVATPPNAIVFGSGYLTIPQMAKAGFWMNLIGIALVTLVLYFIILPIIGGAIGQR